MVIADCWGCEITRKTTGNPDAICMECRQRASQDSVKRYILKQQGKDIFEYNVFNNPDKQQKIGDFTG
jgi:tRNA 2-selenouridine synthase SelU